MQATDRNVKVLPGSDNMSTTVVVEGKHMDVRIVVSRSEPDSSDDERRAICTCEVQAVDRVSGKVLAFTVDDDYAVHGGLSSHMLEAVRDGDFDLQIRFVQHQAARGLGISVDDKVKFIVSHSGDSSVGIAGEQAEVLLDASGFNAEDRAGFIENAREALAKAFGSIWEFKPSVRTEAELQAEGPHESGAAYHVRSADSINAVAAVGAGVATSGNGVLDALLGGLKDQIPDDDGVTGIAFRDALESMILALNQRGVDVSLIASAVEEALDAYGNNEISLGAAADVKGFVLAFPGASDAEADELVTMLKSGGNTVVRVEGDAAGLALHAGLEQAGLEADDFQP